MQPVKITLRSTEEKLYWAHVRSFNLSIDYFCYITVEFPTKKQALEEARSFCKWKKMRIRKIEDDTKQ